MSDDYQTPPPLPGADPEFAKVILDSMTPEELRAFAADQQRIHDPYNQADNPYERCALCHYTRHPCEMYEMATHVLMMLDQNEGKT